MTPAEKTVSSFNSSAHTILPQLVVSEKMPFAFDPLVNFFTPQRSQEVNLPPDSTKFPFNPSATVFIPQEDNNTSASSAMLRLERFPAYCYEQNETTHYIYDTPAMTSKSLENDATSLPSNMTSYQKREITVYKYQESTTKMCAGDEISYSTSSTDLPALYFVKSLPPNVTSYVKKNGLTVYKYHDTLVEVGYDLAKVHDTDIAFNAAQVDAENAKVNVDRTNADIDASITRVEPSTMEDISGAIRELKSAGEASIPQDHLIAAPMFQLREEAEPPTYEPQQAADVEYLGQQDIISRAKYVHHINWLGYPMFSETNTSPATSLVIIMTYPKKFGSLVEIPDTKLCNWTVLRNTLCFIDPVIYWGSLDALHTLTGSQLQETVTGCVRKFYSGCGHWLQTPSDDLEEMPLHDKMTLHTYEQQDAILNGWYRNHSIPTRKDYHQASERAFNNARKEVNEAVSDRREKKIGKSPLSQVMCIVEDEVAKDCDQTSLAPSPELLRVLESPQTSQVIFSESLSEQTEAIEASETDTDMDKEGVSTGPGSQSSTTSSAATSPVVENFSVEIEGVFMSMPTGNSMAQSMMDNCSGCCEEVFLGTLSDTDSPVCSALPLFASPAPCNATDGITTLDSEYDDYLDHCEFANDKVTLSEVDLDVFDELVVKESEFKVSKDSELSVVVSAARESDDGDSILLAESPSPVHLPLVALPIEMSVAEESDDEDSVLLAESFSPINLPLMPLPLRLKSVSSIITPPRDSDSKYKEQQVTVLSKMVLEDSLSDSETSNSERSAGEADFWLADTHLSTTAQFATPRKQLLSGPVPSVAPFNELEPASPENVGSSKTENPSRLLAPKMAAIPFALATKTREHLANFKSARVGMSSSDPFVSLKDILTLKPPVQMRKSIFTNMKDMIPGTGGKVRMAPLNLVPAHLAAQLWTKPHQLEQIVNEEEEDTAGSEALSAIDKSSEYEELVASEEDDTLEMAKEHFFSTPAAAIATPLNRSAFQGGRVPRSQACTNLKELAHAAPTNIGKRVTWAETADLHLYNALTPGTESGHSAALSPADSPPDSPLAPNPPYDKTVNASKPESLDLSREELMAIEMGKRFIREMLMDAVHNAESGMSVEKQIASIQAAVLKQEAEVEAQSVLEEEHTVVSTVVEQEATVLAVDKVVQSQVCKASTMSNSEHLLDFTLQVPATESPKADYLSIIHDPVPDLPVFTYVRPSKRRAFWSKVSSKFHAT